MRGRTLILVGLVVLAVAVVAGVLLWPRPEPEPVLEGTPGPTPLPENVMEILVAAQDTIPRGTRITAESGAVTTAIWPKESVPEGTLVEIEDVYDHFTRVDIMRDMPITENMLTEQAGELGAMGSDIALMIPSGKVAYALPVARYSSVAWAVQSGDHVDVIVSFLIASLDEEFQSPLPNLGQCIAPADDPACTSLNGPVGRLEVLPNNWVVNLMPSEPPRPRLVTQLAVQNAVVLYIGDWKEKREEPPVDEETAGEETEQPVEEPLMRADVEPVTLVVTPQDAMVLKYALETGADIDLVLRSAGDAELITTESVTLQYILDRFSVERPPKLPYGVESLPGTASEMIGGESGTPRE